MALLAAAFALPASAQDARQNAPLRTQATYINLNGGGKTLPPAFEGTDGNFYGTTYQGGANGDGTIFKITPSGALATLYSFCSQSSCADGEYPLAALTQGTNGTFYGTTYNGGTNGDGTVFSLSVGLGPFVETDPISGNVRGAVNILGTDLTGATKVTFHGIAATFIVVSNSEITTTVPTGATTGTVKVVTQGGTLSSNVPFAVN